MNDHNPLANSYGLTANEAKAIKFKIDCRQDLSPILRLDEKQSISNQIADPIDREKELQFDVVDYLAERLHALFHHSCHIYINLAHFHQYIDFFAHARKRAIETGAENMRRYHQLMPWVQRFSLFVLGSCLELVRVLCQECGKI